MGKTKRAATRTTFPRAPIAARTKSAAPDQSGGSSPARRGAPSSGPGREKLAMPADDNVLDEWLEPDEDADVDQWLHEHGAEGVDDD